MSSPVRKGEEYDMVSNFLETTSLGHYERMIQCADLLRKPWKYVVEMPYVSIFTVGREESTVSSYQNSQLLDMAPSPQLFRPRKRLVEAKKSSFFFAGRLYLYGSERVCSVRVALLQLLDRNDTTLVDITPKQREMHPIISRDYYSSMENSDFCLVTRADSHTTASFYEAIAANCVPVVVSDWLVPAFRWWIPYDKFVIKITEEDFLSNPNDCLDYIKITFTRDKINIMKHEMSKWQPFISYSLQLNSEYPDNPSMYPFDLLLIELRNAAVELKSIFAKNPSIKPEDVPKKLRMGPTICFNPYNCDASLEPVRMNGQVRDTRMHLCHHGWRLIGRYKIVYFMQCVRMFWTLRPGLMKPVDSSISPEEKSFVYNFHNITIDGQATQSWDVYPSGGVNGNTANYALADGRSSVFSVN